MAKTLRATDKAIAVHVVGYRMHDVIETREQGITDMKYLAEQTGGKFIAVASIDELVDALNRTLGCPLISKIQAPALNSLIFARETSTDLQS